MGKSTTSRQTEALLRIEIARDGPTVYVEPKLLAKIAFKEIQVNSRYVSGLALRFARVNRYRPDNRRPAPIHFQPCRIGPKRLAELATPYSGRQRGGCEPANMPTKADIINVE